MVSNLVIILGLQNSGDTLKTTLSQSFIINKLSINVKPALCSSGKVIFEPNPDQKPYFVFDDHREAPVAFGVKVSLTNKTYLIQRRVASSDRNVSEGNKPSSVLKVQVGNVYDFPGLDQARDVARQLVQTMFATKKNPNKIKREMDASELTISEVFSQYRQHLLGRSKPAKPNTLSVLDKAENRLKGMGWSTSEGFNW